MIWSAVTACPRSIHESGALKPITCKFWWYDPVQLQNPWSDVMAVLAGHYEHFNVK